MHYVWCLIRGYRLIIAVRTLLGIGKVATILSFVWLSKTAIDCATGRIPSSTRTLIMWFSLMVTCMVVDLILTQSVKHIEQRVSVRMNNSLSRRLFHILLLQGGARGKTRFHSGDMLNRLTVDLRTVTSFIVTQLPAMVVLFVQLVASFAFLASFSPYLALIPIVIMPVCVVVGKLCFRRQRTLTAEIRQYDSEIHITLQEGLRHRIVIITLQCLNEVDRRLGSLQQLLDGANRSQTSLSVTSSAITRLGVMTGFLCAFGWGLFSLKAGIITFGTMTAFLQLINRIQNPIAGLAGYVPAFISTSVAVDRLREIDLPAGRKSKRKPAPPLPRAGVRISNMSFRYDADGPAIFTGFNHDFLPGSRTMIVGSTGAGKTTLIRLLLGILTPDSGSIEVYGEGCSYPVSRSVMNNFIYVPQGNTLLHGTIRDNMLLAAPEATDQQIWEALHTAAADFVSELPQGLDTPCDEDGGGLSEGQAQRIGIARALLRPGAILVLDEFNSALDTDTASLLMERLTATHPDSTVIIIAHHKSTVEPYCDTVLTVG